MSTMLTVPVSDAVLARLRQHAAAQGTTPEAVAADCLAESPRLRPVTGRLRDLCGKLTSDLTDASVRTDEIVSSQPGARPSDTDPLMKWAGTFDSGENADWLARHDEHLGRAALDPHTPDAR